MAATPNKHLQDRVEAANKAMGNLDEKDRGNFELIPAIGKVFPTKI